MTRALLEQLANPKIGSGPCVSCGAGSRIICAHCGAFTCWQHRHNYGTHHEALFTVGDEIMWGPSKFRITAAYADHRRWKYDGYLSLSGGLERPAIGVWESDLTGQK